MIVILNCPFWLSRGLGALTSLNFTNLFPHSRITTKFDIIARVLRLTKEPTVSHYLRDIFYVKRFVLLKKNKSSYIMNVSHHNFYFSETTAMNPQFHIQIPRSGAAKCHVVVSVVLFVQCLTKLCTHFRKNTLMSIKMTLFWRHVLNKGSFLYRATCKTKILYYTS